MTVQFGPRDDLKFPLKSMGMIFYEKLSKYDHNKMFLTDSGTNTEISYEQFLKLSFNLANSLKKLGIKKGDVITIISENSWKYLVTIIAGFYLGVKINLLNHDYKIGEFQHFLSICQPILLFCTSKNLEKILTLKEEICPHIKIISYDVETSEVSTSIDDFLETNNSNFDVSDIVDIDPKVDVAVILTSSGTTGLPKVVLLTHANIRASVLYICHPDYADTTEADSIIAILPFFHVFGLILVLSAILIGSKLIIIERFVPDRFLQLIQQHKVTKLFSVPSLLHFLIKHPLVDKYDISSIRDVICGGAALTEEIQKQLFKRMNIVCFKQCYGMTEIGGAATITPKNTKKFNCVGKVTVGHQIKICDPKTGETLKENMLGELRIKGNGVMKGYLNNVEENAKIFDEDGFVKSGDLGYFDEQGLFYVCDRLKDVIKYKCYQVSPTELENILIQHPAVEDAAVVGKPDERDGEVPTAFVVKRQDVTEEELIYYVKARISVQKQLRGGVRFVQAIPKSVSGKILRKNLIQLL
ncbi:luciferin 4-monooxygenase-like isoform X1 [Tenebrio molitor]|uniref:luciferin 4-monooxygenase-like isoform X1 n=1 Tax=Tenebrio molitor TaxID=7067 RepID=UPI0036247FD6